MENTKEKSCRNCKSYLEHYIKRNCSYVAIGGHCINRELNAKQSKYRYRLHDNCEYWESDDSKKAERREDIKTVLNEMNERLRQIKLILEDDR